MALWGSLKNIFENPLPDSLSPWIQLPTTSVETEISFDIFGEICYQVKPDSSSSNYSPPLVPLPCSSRPCLDRSSSWNGTLPDVDENAFEIFGELCYKTKSEPVLNLPDEDGDVQEEEVQSPKKLDNCTEDLSLESLADADANGRRESRKKKVIYARNYSDVRSKYTNGSFPPPPITSISRCGKPRVYFKSYRQDGRFVLREVRIPAQRLLHTKREDGRLRMQVVGSVESDGRGEKGERRNEGGEER